MLDRRLLLVHAHPDDETITTGATMAHYAARGASVTLVTCTLGEEGEILVPELAQLVADRADQLGGYRIGELAAAMRALGVADHRFLGGAGRFRDSGMIGTPANEHPRAFWRADSDPAVFDEAVDALVAVIREVRPQVVVTYDDVGDYGHPDHIMAHRVTTAAVERAGDPGHGTGPAWTVAKLYWTASPVGDLRRDAAVVADRGGPSLTPMDVDHLPFGVPDDVVTTTVDATQFQHAKLAALDAHRTQVVVDAPFYALSNLYGRLVRGVEHFRLARGERGPDVDAAGHEPDLFAGLDDADAPGPVPSDAARPDVALMPTRAGGIA